MEAALLVGPIWLGAVGLVVGAGGLIVAVVVRGEWVVVVVMLFILVMALGFGEDARVGDVENWISDGPITCEKVLLYICVCMYGLWWRERA